MRSIISKLSVSILIIIVTSVLVLNACNCQPSSNGHEPTNGEEPTEDWIADGTITSGEYVNTGTYGNYTLFYRTDEDQIYIGINIQMTYLLLNY